MRIKPEVAVETRWNRYVGWELVFRVPRSVSIAHAAAEHGRVTAWRQGDLALAERHAFVRDEFEAAVEDAAAAGLAAAERMATAMVAGVGGVGATWRGGRGLVAASFLRQVDGTTPPDLQVRMVVWSRLRCGDGVWRAIDGQDLLAQEPGFSAIASRALVEGVYARLGLEWVNREDGRGKELAVIPAEVCAAGYPPGS
jgi:hypothetical protein